MKKYIINFIKLAIGLGLIYWLVTSGDIQFSDLKIFINNPKVILLASGLIVFKILFNAFRLKAILKTTTKKDIPFLEVLSINWIGLFFSSVLPGAVVGDLIKIGFYNKYDISKKLSFMTIFFDRFIGVFGLITLAAVMTALSFNQNISDVLYKLSVTNLTIFFGLIILLLFFFYAPFIKINRFPEIHEALLSIKKDKFKIVFLIFLSALSHLWALCALYVIVQSLGNETTSNFVNVLMIAPLGFVAQSLPIAPAGMGVSHAAFDYLFDLINIDQGASRYNVYWLLTIAINLFGVLPFGASRHSKN